MTQVWFGCLTNDNNGIFRYHLLHSVFIKKTRLYLQLREDAVKSWLIWTTVEFDISWNYHDILVGGLEHVVFSI